MASGYSTDGTANLRANPTIKARGSVAEPTSGDGKPCGGTTGLRSQLKVLQGTDWKTTGSPGEPHALHFNDHTV